MSDRSVRSDSPGVDPGLPDPALVVLIGASGSGKSTWANARYRVSEIVSSDQLRGVVGSGPADLEASTDAFALLDAIGSARARRGLTCVIDTLGLDPQRRRGYLALARASGLPAAAVLFNTDPAICRTRNAERDRPVPAAVLSAQLARMRALPGEMAAEGWDVVVEAAPGPVAPSRTGAATITPTLTPPGTAAPTDPGPVTPTPDGPHMSVYLQLSRFPWGEDPAGWLRSIALAAVDAGFHGLALMDHLIQIPQVGRAWEPIPEPFVTLGFLAASVGTGVTGNSRQNNGFRWGTLVSPVTFRAPGLLAKTVATLDVLTGGHTFCGLGAGWWEREHQAFGLPFPTAGRRLDQLETAIETIRALWAPGTKAFQGQSVSLPETTFYPRPVGRIPIVVGGGGEHRTLRIAARLADACNLPSDLDTLERKIPILHRHCREAGRAPDDVAITVLDIPIIGTDREHTATLVERLRGRTSAAVFARRHPAGTAADHVRRYRTLLDRGVRTVFLSLPDLTGPHDVLRCAPLTQITQ